MNKFEKMALIGRFTSRDRGLTIQELEALMEIITATPNETVCVELLLDVYEMPKISLTPIKTLLYDDRALIVFLSYNKFTNTVTYGYNKQANKLCWVLKDGPEPTFAEITEEMTGYEGNQMRRVNIKTSEEFRTLYKRVIIKDDINLSVQFEGTCDLKDWQ